MATKAVLHVFEDYQKARISFVQTIAELSTHQQNVEALYSAGIMPLLKPLLLDVVPSIQQSAALAIGRLATYSEELAESVAQNDIIPQLMYSLPKQNRFFKKAACQIIKAVAQHSVELAQSIVDTGALESLVQTLNEFDPSVKEAAAIALGQIAKHNENLARQVVEARATDSLLLCLQEPELILKRVSSHALANICKHTEQLAQPVAENGLDVVTSYLNYTDTNIKRNVTNLLTNVAKHSAELATLVLSKIVNPQKLLNCLKDNDAIVRNNAAMCLCEIVNKCPENAIAICQSGGPTALVNYIKRTEGDAKLYGILSLAYMSAYKEDMAMQIINAGALDVLKDAMDKDNEQVKSAVCFALNHLGRHSPDHSNEVSNNGILASMLFYYMDPNTSDDLKEKAREALVQIISNCSNLTMLEPLLQVASREILTSVLGQFAKYLKGNQDELCKFAKNGGLQKVLTMRSKMEEPMLHLAEEIIALYPKEIVNYYSPEYAKMLLDQVVGDDVKKKEDKKVEEEKKEAVQEVQKTEENKANAKGKTKGKVPSAKKKK